MWFVYILRCTDDTFYTGITTDISRRIRQHTTDNKLACKYVRVSRPVKLFHQEMFDNRRDAESKKLSWYEKKALIFP